MSNSIKFELYFNPKMQLADMKSGISRIESNLQKIKLPSNLTQGLKSTFTSLKSEVANFEKLTSKSLTSMSEVKKVEKSFNTIVGLYKRLGEEENNIKGLSANKLIDPNFASTLKILGNQLNKVSNSVDKTTNNISKNSETIKKNTNEINNLKKANKDLEDLQDKAKDKTTQIYTERANKIENNTRKIEELTEANRTLKNEQKELQNQASQSTQSFDSLRQKLADLAGVKIDKIPRDINEIQLYINNLRTDKIREIQQEITKMSATAPQLENGLRGAGEAVEKMGSKASSLQSMNAQIDQLTNRMTYFFSLTNAWNVFRRVVGQAKEAVKELDAAMTEIAVVSKYTINDIWAMRQSFSASATAMGAKTLDLINATKLYVQQGLELNEAMSVGIETTKMARIANLSGAEATNLMTSALRGFNMEMSRANEVNDTYSNLAAKSAADTYEIATAMSKAASIAYNAGASFENTAAFLTQIIETTREAPETAGTALKTVIARFAELKKAPSEIGEVDGEIVDANKIETALRTAGIAARDAKGNFRDFDDIIIELAGKWDGLDKMTQRYIATMAAGSRQQSRFIALLANNARLTELLGYANNAAGASQEQFNKTLDSLEAKMNKLSNAWDIFVTNLANSEAIKFVVDLLTTLVNTLNSFTAGLNSLTGPLGSVGGLISTVITAAMLVAGFAGGMALVKGISSAIKAYGPQEGEKASAWFLRGVKKAFTFHSSIIGKESMDALSQAMANNRSNRTTFTKVREALAKDIMPLDETQKVAQQTMTKVMSNMQNTMKDISPELKNQMNDIFKNSMDAVGNASNNSDVTKAMNGFKKKMEDLKGVTKEQEKAMNEAFKDPEIINGIEKASINLNSLGTYAASAGMTINMLNGLLQSLGAYGEDTGKIISSIGTGLMVFGMIFPILTKLAKGFAVAGYKTLAAWGWVALIVVAITAIIAGAILLINTIDNLANHDNKVLEDLQNKTKAAQEEAKKASEAYDKLLSGRDSYNELQQQLSNLTKGTSEWTEALWKANQQALELIQTYDNLEYTVDDSGQIKITNMNEVIQEQQKKVLVAQQQTANATYLENMQKRYMTGKATLGTAGIGVDYYNEEFAAKSNKEILDNLKAIEDKYGRDSDEYKKEKTIYEAKIEGERSEKENQALFRSQIQATLSKNIVETGYSKEIGQMFADQALEKINSFQLEENYNKYKGNQLKELLGEYGIADAGSEIEKLQKLYASMKGIQIEDISDSMKDNENALRQAIATMHQLSLVSDRMDTLATTLKRSSKTQQTAILALGQDQGESFTAGFAKAMKEAEIDSSTTKEKFIDFIESQTGLTVEELMEIYNVSDINELKDILIENYKSYATDMGIFKRKIKEMSFSEELTNFLSDETSNLGKGLSQRIKEDLANQMKTIDELGVGSSSEVFAQYQKIIDDNNLNIEEATEVYSILSKVNVTNIDSIKGLISEFIQLGKDIPISAIEDLQNTLIEFGKAIKVMTKEELVDNITTVSKIIKDSKSGELGRSISEEQYKAIVDQMPTMESQFIKTLEGDYVYTGKSIQDLIVALDKNTAALLGKNVETLEDKVAAGEAIESYFGSGVNVGWTKDNVVDASGKLTVADIKTIVDAFDLDTYKEKENVQGQAASYHLLSILEDLKSKGIDTSSFLGFNIQAIENVQEKIKEIITSGKLEDTWNTLLEQFYNLPQNRIDLSSLQNEINPITYQTESPFILANQYEDEDALKALIAQANAVEGVTTEVNKLTVAMANGSAEEKKTAAHTLAHATALQKMNTAYKTVQSSLEDYNKTLEEGSTADQKLALDNLAKSLKQMFGVEFSSDWVSENMGKIKTLCEGGEEAFQTFKEIAGTQVEELSKTIEEECKDGEIDFKTFQGFLDQQQLLYRFGADTEELDRQIVESYNKLVASSNATTAEIEAAYQNILNSGIEVKVEWGYIDNATGEIIDSSNFNSSNLRSSRNYTKFAKSLSYVATKKETSGDGWRGIFDGNRGSKGSGGSSKEDTPWEQSYDWLYNLIQRTNKEIRVRNKLEKDYNNLVDQRYDNSVNVLRNLREQENSLKKQKQYYEEQLSGRQKELADLQSEYADVSQYVYFANGMAQINYDAIKGVSGTSGNNDLGERIDKAFSAFEEIQGKIEDVEDSLTDINDTIKELQDQGGSEYRSLEDRVKASVEKLRQDEIDELSAINDAINNANQEIINKLQEGIQEYRDAREEDKTKRDIEDAERRLALMQSDTSGANILDILAAQKELQEKRESYTDSLIDKQIDEMTKQNEEAARQRQDQIDLMTEILKNDIETGVIAQEVNRLLSDMISGDSNSIVGQLKDTELYQGMAAKEQDEWVDTIWKAINAGSAYWENKYAAGKKASGQTISFTDKEGVSRTGTVDSSGRVKVGNDYYGGVYQNPLGEWVQSAKGVTDIYTPPPAPVETIDTASSSQYFNRSGYSGNSIIDALKSSIYGTKKNWPSNYGLVRDLGYSNQTSMLNAIAAANGLSGGWLNNAWAMITMLANGELKRPNAYLKGGLVDSTGLAWLDGTKARPELVLNAEDTQNFIQLKNILGNLLASDEGKGLGDNYYNISIDVDHINSDYDVEQLMSKLKKMIEDDASYRNVNAVDLNWR